MSPVPGDQVDRAKTPESQERVSLIALSRRGQGGRPQTPQSERWVSLIAVISGVPDERIAVGMGIPNGCDRNVGVPTARILNAVTSGVPDESPTVGVPNCPPNDWIPGWDHGQRPYCWPTGQFLAPCRPCQEIKSTYHAPVYRVGGPNCRRVGLSLACPPRTRVLALQRVPRGLWQGASPPGMVGSISKGRNAATGPVGRALREFAMHATAALWPLRICPIFPADHALH